MTYELNVFVHQLLKQRDIEKGTSFKVAATDMRRFARNLVHKKSLALIWQVVFKLKYLFCQGR